MAPALTEAAGQAQKLKLPFAPPPSSRRLSSKGIREYDEDDDGGRGLVVVDQQKLEKSFLLLANLPTVEVGYKRGAGGDERSGLGRRTRSSRTPSPSSMTTALCCSQCTMNGEHEPTTTDEEVVDCQKQIKTTSMGSVVKPSPSDAALIVGDTNKIQQQQADDAGLSDAVESKRSSLVLAEKTAARDRFQANVERRAERLVRRMCKLRAMQASQHVSRQLVEFVDYQRKALQLPSSSERLGNLLNIRSKINSSSSSSSSNNGVGVEGKGTTASSLVNLLNRLESSHNSNLTVKQQAVLLDYVQRYGGQLPMTGSKTTTAVAAKLDRDTCDKMERTCGSLLTNLGYLDREVDSDATASSSGGESCDEAEGNDDRKFKTMPIQKRAFWKWAMDRASVVSRWTWLQAQVSDLEYRIRQTSEIHRQIRRMKDSPFGDKTFGSSSASQVNGFVVNHESSCDTSCRTCPLKPIRKRKLLRTSGLYKVSRKAAKLSTVRCSCAPPSSQCAICCGRPNCVQSLNADTMPMNERAALLDPSFHPVLSFTRDISLSIHFEDLLRNDEHSKFSSKQRNVAAVKKKPRVLQINDHARKQCRKLKKNATVTLTAKLRKKTNDKHLTRGRGRNSGNRHCRLRKRSKQISTSSSKHSRERNFSGSSGCCSKSGSPVPSPEVGDNSSSQASGNSSWGSTDPRDHRRGSMLHDMLRRRRGESAFDINNIVIPYSMAAATRVEILQYKEILTPKWRAVEDTFVNNGTNVCNVLDDEVVAQEDISDEAIVRRHDRCEHTEKKRFLGFMKKPGLGVRRARSMRSDSRADSSGDNTPDPMSPHAVEPHDSPLTTPPSTPAPVVIAEEQHQQNQPLPLSQRRRTTSLSKRDRILDDIRVATPSDILYEHVPVPPWEQRTFPLEEQLYEQMVQESASSEVDDSFDLACNSVPENEWNGGGGSVTTAADVVSSSYEETPAEWVVTPIGGQITGSVSQHDLVVK